MINPSHIKIVTETAPERSWMSVIRGELRLSRSVTVERSLADNRDIQDAAKKEIISAIWFKAYGDFLPVLVDLSVDIARHMHPMHLKTTEALVNQLIGMIDFPFKQVSRKSESLEDDSDLLEDVRIVPARIHAAAMMIDHYFTMQGCTEYAVGPIQSRQFGSSTATSTAAPRSEEGQKQDVGPSDKTSARDESQTSSNGAASAPSPCVTTAMPPDGPAESSPGHGRIPIDIVAAAEEH